MYENELYHHGILGMRWGIRRYQPYGSGGYNPKKKGKNVGTAAKSKPRIHTTSPEESRRKAPVGKVELPDPNHEPRVLKRIPRMSEEIPHKYKSPIHSWLDSSTRSANSKTDRIRKERSDAVKRRSSMSDKELERRVKRLSNELRLKELTEKNEAPGKAKTKDILLKAGEKAVGAVVTGVAVYAVYSVLRKAGINIG